MDELMWVNLPRASQMTTPRYQPLLNNQIPVAYLVGGGGMYGSLPESSMA
ncbi:MAG: hypothetical protein JSR62_04420 [Nitrospira sp.]|nr:hypothetical protein [Nitrospira sp.]